MRLRKSERSSHELSASASCFVQGAKKHEVFDINAIRTSDLRGLVAAVSTRSSVINRDQMESDIFMKKEVMIDCIEKCFPEMSSFLGNLIDEFVCPMWTTVSCSRKSQISILPEVCSFPVSRIPCSWCQPNSGQYLLCKTFPGNWTLINTNHLFGERNNVVVPSRLQILLIALHSLAMKGQTSVVFDEENGEVYVCDIELNREIMTLYILESETATFKLFKKIDELTQGAMHVYGIHQRKLVYSIGRSIFIDDLYTNEPPCYVVDALIPTSYGESTPLSVQAVIPVITPSERILYISNGAIWAASLKDTLQRRCIFKDESVDYVASACDIKSMRAVVVGFRKKEGHTMQTITIVDLHGEFIVSTVCRRDDRPFSIVSVSVNPVCSDVIILGRGRKTPEHGAISYTLPGVYK